MQLRGLSARTQACDVAAVRQFAELFHTSPDRLTEEPLRQYFLYLANDKQVARATATIALCAESGRRSGSSARRARRSGPWC